MSNPSGDSTIHDLPTAATINGSEEFVVDQVQGPIRVTVKVPASFFPFPGITGSSIGTTAQRPLIPVLGQSYVDTTLGIPIWCIQISPSIKWIDAAGVQV